MTGPRHYREAEKLVALAANLNGVDPVTAREYLTAAHVHATLALAAASAWPVVDRYKGDSYLTNEWSDAIGWVIPAEIVEDDG